MNSQKDSYFFRHDSNAKDDPKISFLIEDLGLEGYGAFWVIIELMRDQSNYKLPLKTIPIIARKYNIEKNKLEKVIKNYDLFVIENDLFYSISFLNRMREIDEIRQRNKENGKKGAEVKKQKTSGAASGATSGAAAVKKSKVNYSKEKEIKRNDIDINMPFTPPDDIKSIQIIFSDWNNIICKQYPEFQKITDSEFHNDNKLQQLLYKLKDKWETAEILTLYGTNEWLRLNAKFLKWWNINNYEKALQGKFDSYKQNAVVKMEDDPWADCEIVNPPKNWKGKK